MTRKVTLVLAAITAIGLSSCGVQTEEREQTRENRIAINAGIPVPQIDFSLRRWVLAQFYKSLARPRLRTCTVITSRGGDKTELAVAATYGSPVNLSNQMTSPEMSEPDSIYSGQNDQSVIMLRNGVGMNVEADTTVVLGECPTTMKKPETALQAIIDYQSTQQPEFSFLAPATPAR